jgi:hypothetical protein
MEHRTKDVGNQKTSSASRGGFLRFSLARAVTPPINKKNTWPVFFGFSFFFFFFFSLHNNSKNKPKMTIGVPIKLLHEAQGHIISLELKTGQLYRGKLLEGKILV